jgi:hypothetical protein
VDWFGLRERRRIREGDVRYKEDETMGADVKC